ncbi:endonuclease NucS domain-containing protein [Elizabethkingia meningoseptica]|uniref:endonuclease NucS domain-containing protein n=1 Tax=Elizabethkingia meningoseptica TaxID=238 RepID=UPI003019DFBA
MPNKIEHIIRDWLVDNPNFIEEELEVIGKEHYLHDDVGTSAYIDILCKDIYNNFVIVEIKRSDVASRQAFTEVLKYAELIKSKYNARNSEIKIIIISTHWDEMIRAYSHLCFNSDFAIKGLQIYLDQDTKLPIDKEEVIPVSLGNLSRKFSQHQMVYLFLTEEKRSKAHIILNKKLEKAQVCDYVTVDLNAPQDKQVFYPYAINFAFQKRSKEDLLCSISLLEGEQYLDMEEEEFENDNEYIDYLDETFIAALEINDYIDSLEIGYAEKFESVTGVQKWKINAINRYGTFKSDPRYNDNLLIKELKGNDGNSRNKFVGFSESSQKQRLQEIRIECQYCVNGTPHWAAFIDYILADLEKSKENFKVIVDIYNPDSIVTALYFTLIEGNPDYLPLFHIIIKYPETNQFIFYVGEIKSIVGRIPKLPMFTSTDKNEIYNELTRLYFMPENEMDAFKMGLNYSIQEVVYIDDNEVSSKYIELDENAIIDDKSNYASIENYIVVNSSMILRMLQNYSSFHKHS